MLVWVSFIKWGMLGMLGGGFFGGGFEGDSGGDLGVLGCLWWSGELWLSLVVRCCMC